MFWFFVVLKCDARVFGKKPKKQAVWLSFGFGFDSRAFSPLRSPKHESQCKPRDFLLFTRCLYELIVNKHHECSVYWLLSDEFERRCPRTFLLFTQCLYELIVNKHHECSIFWLLIRRFLLFRIRRFGRCFRFRSLSFRCRIFQSRVRISH